MKRKISMVIGGLLVAVLAFGAVGATNVFAQGSVDTPLHGPGGRGPGGRGLSDEALAAAAEVLEMTADEVKSALQSGQTLQDLADEAGVDIEDVRAPIQAVRETEMRERIAQAVEDGANRLLVPEAVKRDFLLRARLVDALYGAVKPDPAA